jgi:hypothetical protein
VRTRLLLLLAAVACGGDDTTTPEPCAPYQGTTFTLDEGAGTVSGTLTFPADLENDLQVEVSVGTGAVWLGVVPANMFELPATCGGPMDFEIVQLEAGTYDLRARVLGASPDDVLAEGVTGPVTSADDAVDGVEIELTTP